MGIKSGDSYKKQGIDPFYGKINYASVSQHALL